MKIKWCSETLDSLANVEYGTRVVQKRDGGTIYPVYGGGGATFFMDTSNRSNRLIISRFGMSEKCTRFVNGDFFLNDSGLTLSPKDTKKISQRFLDYQCLSLNDEIYKLGKGAAQKNLDLPAFRAMLINYPESIELQEKIIERIDLIVYEIERATIASTKKITEFNILRSAILKKAFIGELVED